MEYNQQKAGLQALYADHGLGSDAEAVYAGIGAALEEKKAKAIAAKQSVERRMLRDLSQYNGDGLHSNMRETKNKPLDGRDSQDTPPSIHLTRTRTDAVASKIINMLVPSNERAWSLGPTPRPEMTDMAMDKGPAMQDTGEPVADDQGQVVPAKELAYRIQQAADKKATAMQSGIDDQLKECHMSAKARRGIHTACKVGTAIFAGPVMTGKIAVIREAVMDQMTGQEIWDKKIVEDTTPGIELVDPFNFYPQPGSETIDSCEYAFEHQYMNRTEVRNLSKLPDFDPEKIKILLDQEVDHGALRPNQAVRQGLDGETIKHKDRYSIWKYVGPLSAKDLEAIGVYEMNDDEDADTSKMCEAWQSQGIVLKVKLSPMEETSRLPYYVFNYKRSDQSLWGYGVPYECQDSARVVDSTWHIALHNSALSSGPQVVIRSAATCSRSLRSKPTYKN